MKKCFVLKFYEDGRHIPSYDEYYYYDLNDDKSFDSAFMAAACKLNRICDRNKNIYGRIETVERL